MTKLHIGRQEFRTTKSVFGALRAARVAITEADRRQRTAPVADEELQHRNADLVRIIERGAGELVHDRLDRTRDGALVIRRGVNPFREDGPRARLVNRLRFEAAKVAGLVCED